MSSEGKRLSPLMRHSLEIGPVLAFFAVLVMTNIYTATGVLMALILLALGIAVFVERRVPPLLGFAAVVVVVFGGLTLALRDEFFIKIRPTVYFTALALLLLGGLWYRRYFLKIVFEMAFQLRDEGWRVLTIRTALMFLFLAAANHVVWTNFSTEFWAGYKLWGQYPLLVLFFIAQAPLLLRHEIKEDASTEGAALNPPCPDQKPDS